MIALSNICSEDVFSLIKKIYSKGNGYKDELMNPIDKISIWPIEKVLTVTKGLSVQRIAIGDFLIDSDIVSVPMTNPSDAVSLVESGEIISDSLVNFLQNVPE